MTKASSGEVLRIANALVGRIVSGDYPSGRCNGRTLAEILG